MLFKSAVQAGSVRLEFTRNTNETGSIVRFWFLSFFYIAAGEYYSVTFSTFLGLMDTLTGRIGYQLFLVGTSAML